MDNSESRETSDVDSEEFERQQRELEELDYQLEQKSKRSNAERRKRKEQMKEMRRLAEEKRKALQESESEEVSPPKKRRESRKSKDGKGVKNKGKIGHENNKVQKVKSVKKRSRMSNAEETSHLTGSSSERESSADEISMTVNRIKNKNKRKQTSKYKRYKKMTLSSSERKSSNKQESDSNSVDSSADSSTSLQSSSSEVTTESESEQRRRKKGKKNKNKKGRCLKSGVKAKAHKIRLKTSELCAQAVLDEEYYPGNMSLDCLTFDQLVAGELEICTMKEISKREKNTRLHILKLLAYFANWLPQTKLLDIYKAIILKVEKGIFFWSSELIVKVENMLDRAVSTNNLRKENETKDKDGPVRDKVDRQKDKNKKDPGILIKSGEKVIYCLEFNKNKCDKDGSHEGKFAGKEVTKLHVCRSCLTIDKEKRFHADGDGKCPHRTA